MPGSGKRRREVEFAARRRAVGNEVVRRISRWKVKNAGKIAILSDRLSDEYSKGATFDQGADIVCGFVKAREGLKSGNLSSDDEILTPQEEVALREIVN